MCSAFDSLIFIKHNSSEFSTKLKQNNKLVDFMCLNFTVFKSVG